MGSPMQTQQMIGDGSGMTDMELQQELAMEQQMMGGYNPLMMSGGQPDIKRVDRWLRVKVPQGADADKFWMTETDLLEELAKSNLTGKEYNWFIREYAEIEAIAGGDGNEMWAKSRQRKFLLRLNLARSRVDNKEVGMRDAAWLMGQNINQKSNVVMPAEENQSAAASGRRGLLGLFGGR